MSWEEPSDRRSGLAACVCGPAGGAQAAGRGPAMLVRGCLQVVLRSSARDRLPVRDHRGCQDAVFRGGGVWHLGWEAGSSRRWPQWESPYLVVHAYACGLSEAPRSSVLGCRSASRSGFEPRLGTLGRSPCPPPRAESGLAGPRGSTGGLRRPHRVAPADVVSPALSGLTGENSIFEAYGRLFPRTAFVVRERGSSER